MLHTALFLLSASIAAPGSGLSEPIESCDDPVQILPPASSAAAPMPRWMTATGVVEHVQVNLDEDGLNILGDAANEPTIAVDPTAPNRMVIFWRQFGNVGSSFRQAGYSWSEDGGRTWSPIGIVRPDRFRSDPVLGSDQFGRFHLLSLQVRNGVFRVLHHLSEDGGKTWSAATNAYGGDKEWLAVHPNGTTLFHHWTNNANRSFSSGLIPPSGENAWEAPTGNLVPTLGNSTIGPDGAWYIAGRGFNDIGLARVDDPLAETLVVPPDFAVWLDGDFTLFEGPNPGGLLGMPQVAVNHAPGPYFGEVYVIAPVHPFGALGDPCELRFNRSIDRGETWLADPVTINDDGPAHGVYQWHGTISTAPNGRIDVVWLDMRNDPDPDDSVYLSELFYTSSMDGGRTWTPNTRLSTSFDSWLGWPSQNKMGDYFHMVSDDVGADLAWAATFEGEQNVYYTRIGPRDCNRNGIADEDDIAAGTLSDCDGNGIPDECEIASGVNVPCYQCPADFAEPFGVIDLADIAGFLVAFNNGDSAADLAEPFGTLDLADISAFVQAFLAGCP